MKEIIMKFGSKDGIVNLRVNRNKRLAWVTSLQTNYKEQQIPWFHIFDPGIEKAQDEESKKLDNKSFVDVFVLHMKALGWELKKSRY